MEYLASLNQRQITHLAARLNVVAVVVALIWLAIHFDVNSKLANM